VMPAATQLGEPASRTSARSLAGSCAAPDPEA
jgi:hypothetical protein